jgi:SNF2 family DNA or RNA helicase
MGVLAGEPIYGHKADDTSRFEAVKALNEETLDGLVISPKVGGCGHNLVGANHVLFMGSMYSQAYENQILGIGPWSHV